MTKKKNFKVKIQVDATITESGIDLASKSKGEYSQPICILHAISTIKESLTEMSKNGLDKNPIINGIILPTLDSLGAVVVNSFMDAINNEGVANSELEDILETNDISTEDAVVIKLEENDTESK